MFNEQTLEKLYAMKLTGMADAFRDQLNQPAMNDLSFEERFAFLVDQHFTWKEDRRMQTLLRQARLKDNACVEDIDYKTPRGIDKSVIMSLSGCGWIKKPRTSSLQAQPGSGKPTSPAPWRTVLVGKVFRLCTKEH